MGHQQLQASGVAGWEQAKLPVPGVNGPIPRCPPVLCHGSVFWLNANCYCAWASWTRGSRQGWKKGCRLESQGGLVCFGLGAVEREAGGAGLGGSDDGGDGAWGPEVSRFQTSARTRVEEEGAEAPEGGGRSEEQVTKPWAAAVFLGPEKVRPSSLCPMPQASHRSHLCSAGSCEAPLAGTGQH